MKNSQEVVDFLKSFFSFLKSRVLSHSVYIGVSALIGFFATKGVTVTDVKPIISTLQNISAAVFTLSGIWIAYSYPQAIAAYTSPGNVKIIPTGETNRIENLVLIVLTSAFVISSTLIFNLSYLLFSPSKLYTENLQLIKSIGISFVFYLCFLQLKAIFVVMSTNISFVNDLHHKKTEKDAYDDL
ncbi:hypothetical protein [Marinimicrobium sp. C2-29]|uniref:hypothetical protein n=1 Tax=Marinimicrobium sp. C2-29 TaxID=3139825 RepID=UPI00313985A7